MIAILIVAGVLAAAPATNTASASEALTGDLGRLQGRWTASAGPKGAFPVTLEFRGREVHVEVRPPVGPPIRARGEVQVDDAVSPKALDWVRFTALDGQALPEILAIYELDGDTFRLCNGGPHNPRPEVFEPGDGVLAEIVTFQRAQDDDVASNVVGR
jgi:uncharacterized protein (TIGR03067 family)